MLDMADPLKLGKKNFHQWEEAVLAQLRAKKGNLDIPLAYVVWKPTPPSTYVDETECLVYEAKRTGPGWEQDKKTIRNYIIGLLAQSNAKTWINAHLMSQDGNAVMASLRTHFLGTTQVERIVQYARTKWDKATFWSQAIYSFECFSTDLQEAFTLLAEYDVTIPEAEQIRLLREKIKTDRADFNAAVVTSRMDGTLKTYADPVAWVSQDVSHFFLLAPCRTHVAKLLCLGSTFHRLHTKRMVTSTITMVLISLISHIITLKMNGWKSRTYGPRSRLKRIVRRILHHQDLRNPISSRTNPSSNRSNHCPNKYPLNNRHHYLHLNVEINLQLMMMRKSHRTSCLWETTEDSYSHPYTAMISCLYDVYY